MIPLNADDLPDPNIDPETEERDDSVIGVALVWSLVVIGVFAIVGGGAVYWITRPGPPPPVKETKLADVQLREAPQVEIPQVPFTDVTAEAGIDFVQENGAYGDKLLPETMGGGCAFLDYDNDGDQDVLLVNSRRWPWDPRPERRPPATCALYQNDGTGHFTDVSAATGLDVSLYGMGAAVGDYDNDGWTDVFLSAVGSNRLFHNVHGKFVDVTEQAGVAGGNQQWSASCGFFDYDNDGDLDLFVCNYVKWSKEYDLAQNFQLTGGDRAYGRPQAFEGNFSYLYRNDGGERFTDVSAQAGIQIRNASTGVPMGKSLGVSFSDFDGDGKLDIVVANDTVQNFLFHNEGDGTFREMGALSGVAFDIDGNARGAMGIDVARFRDDGSAAIAIGNFSNEMTALYVSKPSRLQFTDEAVSNGLGPVTRLELTFGLFFFDCDLDGRLDLFAANGHLEKDINKVQPSQHYEQSPQLLWNCGPQFANEFVNMPADKCGKDFVRPMVGRGAACADIDGDGDLDLLIAATGQSPKLLRNDQNTGHHWLRVKLYGTVSNRDAIGAWVEVHHAGSQRDSIKILRRQVMPTKSYLSQCELPVTFGLGDAAAVEKVVIRWPDGSSQTVSDVPVDRMITVTQSSELRADLPQIGVGSGRAAQAGPNNKTRP